MSSKQDDTPLKIPRGILSLLLIGIASGYFVFLAHRKETVDAPARAAGFIDAAHQERAKRAGFADAVAWKEMTRNPASDMKLANLKWRLGGFDNVGLISMIVENGNSFDVKDIEMKCQFNAKSGTQLSERTHTIFDIVPANGKKAFNDVNIGLIHNQSSGASCWVERARRR